MIERYKNKIVRINYLEQPTVSFRVQGKVLDVDADFVLIDDRIKGETVIARKQITKIELVDTHGNA